MSRFIRSFTNVHSCFSYPLAIELLESGKINVKPLITQRFAIEQALEAFRLLASPPDNDQSVVKVLIQYNKDDD